VFAASLSALAVGVAMVTNRKGLADRFQRVPAGLRQLGEVSAGVRRRGFPDPAGRLERYRPRLHFMGVHFQRKRKSATLLGVAEDATVLAERIARR
jgi:hypothetical protein